LNYPEGKRVDSYKTREDIRQYTLRHTPKDLNVREHRSKQLTSRCDIQ